MSSIQYASIDGLLDVSAGLVRSDSVVSAVESVVSMAEATFEEPIFLVWRDSGEVPTLIEQSTAATEHFTGRQWVPPVALSEDSQTLETGHAVEAESTESQRLPFQSELLLEVDESYVLCLRSTESAAFDDRDRAILDGLGSALEAAFDRIGENRPCGDDQCTRQKIDIFDRVYEVITDLESSFDEKVDALLEAGRKYLDLPTGFLTRVETDGMEGPGIQTIVHAQTSHEFLQAGEQCPLPKTYCRRTIQDTTLTTITHAAEAGWVGDPAYETFGLETYIAGPVDAGGNTYGTLCFSSREPRETEFTAIEQSFVGFLRRWIGYEIERRREQNELRQKQQRLELTLSETNSGIAEWEPATDAMTWNQTLVELVGTDVDSIEEFREVIHHADRDRILAELVATLETGEPWVGEFRIVSDSGVTRWLRTRAIPTYDGEGEPPRVIATATDITEEKSNECERLRNERRFQSLFEDPEILVGLLNADGTVLEVNETALSYVDVTNEDIQGEAFWETPWWTHSTELQADLQNWIQRAADGEYVEYSATHRCPDDEIRHISGTIRPVTSESGSVESLVVSGRDVTERKRQQDELRNRQQKLGLILSNTNTSIAEMNVETGIMTWDEAIGDNNIWSPATLEEFIDTVHPDDRSRLREDVSAAIESGEQLDGEYRMVDEDGGCRWIATRAVQVEDAQNSATLLAIATDVTELKERTRRLQAIFNGTFQFIGLLAPDGTVLEANESALTFGGLEREAVVGERFYNVSWWTHSKKVQSRVRDVIEEAANGEFVRYETEVDGVEGLATIDFSVKPVTDETGEVTSIIVEGRDITAQRQRRQHLDVLQRIMRHNMRNDLTKVRNWAQVMSTEPDSHARAAHFDRIVSVLDKWDDMSTKLKQIQHAIQSEKMHWADVDPASLVSEIVSERNNAHPDATIETTTAAVESQQTPALLTSVLTQLIDNSVEATEQGAAYVEVSLSQPDTAWLEFTVRDSGPGMPHAEAEMLETGEETQLTHGSSLGLWMVRMFVKQVGGDVSVDVSAAGTVVTLRIPAHQHREPQPRAL